MPSSLSGRRWKRLVLMIICCLLGCMTCFVVVVPLIHPSLPSSSSSTDGGDDDEYVDSKLRFQFVKKQQEKKTKLGEKPQEGEGERGEKEGGVANDSPTMATTNKNGRIQQQQQQQLRFPTPKHSLIHPKLLTLLNDPSSMPDLVAYHEFEDNKRKEEEEEDEERNSKRGKERRKRGVRDGGGGGEGGEEDEDNHHQRQPPNNHKDDQQPYRSPYDVPPECNVTELNGIKESTSNLQFLRAFAKIFSKEFRNIPWWLDEGGLIGSSRGGHMNSADDDFDFFALLPNQTAPCRANSLSCYRGQLGKGRGGSDGPDDEYKQFIHRFLMTFWTKGGMCINKFSPDLSKFESKGRLMFSFQLDPKGDRFKSPESCFKEGKPFAHMHLGMLLPIKNGNSNNAGKEEEEGDTENVVTLKKDSTRSSSSDKENIGVIETNVWAKHTTHPIDQIPLHLVLPIRRCRAGHLSAPCPNSVVKFLSVRNRGEYVNKGSGDGSCLLMRKKWDMRRRVDGVRRVRALDECGYASMVDLVEPYVESGYQWC